MKRETKIFIVLAVIAVAGVFLMPYIGRQMVASLAG